MKKNKKNMSLCCIAGQNAENEKWLLDSVAEEEGINDNAQWMTNLRTPLTNIPITQLSIPGSHDSGAYYLDLGSPVSPGNAGVF